MTVAGLVMNYGIRSGDKMPYLQSDINVGHQMHITEEDREPLKALLTKAAEFDSPKIIYYRVRAFGTETIVAKTEEVFRVLREMDEEKDWALTKKMARKAEGKL